MRTIIAFATLIFVICVASAQQRTMAMYGDWTLSCVNASGSGAGKSCGLVQVQKIEGQTDPVSQISIGRNAKGEPFKISLEVHANAWIPSGVKLITNDKAPPIIAMFTWCTATRCHADAELSDSDLKRLRAQKEQGQISYMNALQGQISIPMSFNGFGEAFDALQSSN